jgi:TrmH family RNA methyltransferase
VNLADIKKLHQKKYRQSFGHYLVEGEHLILELQKAAIRQPALEASELYVSGS